jgi:hypothetical protein
VVIRWGKTQKDEIVKKGAEKKKKWKCVRRSKRKNGIGLAKD